MIFYHGSKYKFSKFEFKNLGKSSGTIGAGYGMYFSSNLFDAMVYGDNVYTCEIELKQGLSNTKRTLTKSKLKRILTLFEKQSETSYVQNWNEDFQLALDNLYHLSNDVDIIGDICNATNEIETMFEVLKKVGISHAVDYSTPIANGIPGTTNICVYDLSLVKILKRQTRTELKQEKNLNENQLSEDELLEAEAKSKVQRRLMAMALMYKLGRLDEKYASETVKKLSRTISEEKLREFASTKQKKRRKDGSIGKRNAIPERVKKTK